MTSRRIAVLALLAGLGCGQVTDERVVARDQATKASCDYFMRCNQIGSGANATFPDRDSCNVQIRSFWENAWPVANCQGKIRQDQLSVCLSAINGTQCGNGINFLTTLGTCSAANVCTGGTDAAAD
jgi:hypothetical protein